MNLYAYDGPVLLFDTCIADHWKGETMAPSERKARSNLTYQFKKSSNRTAGSKITLPGDVVLVTKGEY